MPVQTDPLRRHGGDGHSGGGQGAVHGVLVTSSNPDPCLSNKKRIGREEELHCGPRLGCSSKTFLLDARPYRAAERPGVLMVPVPECHNPGVDKTPGFR